MSSYDYLDDYAEDLGAAIATISRSEYDAAFHAIYEAMAASRPIYVFGNGGSAAVANHFLCDCLKGVSEGSLLRPRIHSLCSDVPLVTALANDLGYASILARQLQYLTRTEQDLGIVIVMSVSGSSRNVVDGLVQAKYLGHTTVAMTGFDGGKAGERWLSDHHVNVRSENYGIVEDAFSMIMHSMSQSIARGAVA
jgi:D-sedoheptulose 7-phosphate isomerase